MFRKLIASAFVTGAVLVAGAGIAGAVQYPQPVVYTPHQETCHYVQGCVAVSNDYRQPIVQYLANGQTTSRVANFHIVGPIS